MEKSVCQNKNISKYCEGEFTITLDDFQFYQKIKVPEPSFCPTCRMQRKYLWRNERTLYRRTCDISGKSIVSMYQSDNRFPVYDIKEWWSDSWDPKDYGQDVDFTRPILQQFKELQNKVPRQALLNKNSLNSEYANHTANSKDIFMSCAAMNAENILYSTNTIPAKNCLDSYRTDGTSNENIYESINIHDCFNVQFCYLVEKSFDCYYSIDLKNCSNCFMSCNLRGQSYYFRNKKYTKEEYFEKINEFNLSSFENREKLYKEWLRLVFGEALYKNQTIESCQQCSGNMMFNSNNSIECFESEKLENCKYNHVMVNVSDSFDMYHGGVKKVELCYECHALMGSSKLMFCHLCYEDTNLIYCDSCHNSNELFCCVGIKKGSYMILNKQYTKEEYFVLKDKIIDYMKSIGEYGVFFAPDLSPFAYNETQAQVYMPLEKEEALKLGYTWKDDMPGTFGKGTIESEDIPDCIEDITDYITKQVLTCTLSGRNYNIVPQELELYRRLKIPIPRIHPDERYKRRIAIRPDRRLYDAQCYLCQKGIKTAYPKDRRPVKTVCEECYKSEVL